MNKKTILYINTVIVILTIVVLVYQFKNLK